MAFLSVIRRWHFRDGLSIREIARRTGLSQNIGTTMPSAVQHLLYFSGKKVRNELKRDNGKMRELG
jgi:transposase